LTTTSTVGGQSPGFDERWAAWQAKGVAHDRAVRRKMAFAALVLPLVVAVVMYALFGR
jgi:hypothetical protein